MNNLSITIRLEIAQYCLGRFSLPFPNISHLNSFSPKLPEIIKCNYIRITIHSSNNLHQDSSLKNAQESSNPYRPSASVCIRLALAAIQYYWSTASS